MPSARTQNTAGDSQRAIVMPPSFVVNVSPATQSAGKLRPIVHSDFETPGRQLERQTRPEALPIALHAVARAAHEDGGHEPRARLRRLKLRAPFGVGPRMQLELAVDQVNEFQALIRERTSTVQELNDQRVSRPPAAGVGLEGDLDGKTDLKRPKTRCPSSTSPTLTSDLA